MAIDPDRLEESVQRLTTGVHDDLGTTAAGPARQLAQVLAAADEILDVDSLGMLLLDEFGVLRAVAASGPAAALTEAAQQELGLGPGVDAVIERRTVVSNDLRADGDYVQLSELLGDDVVRALISAPIRVGGEIVGNLNAVGREPRNWSDGEIAAVEAFAAVVSTLLDLSADAPPGPATPEEVALTQGG